MYVSKILHRLSSTAPRTFETTMIMVIIIIDDNYPAISVSLPVSYADLILFARRR